MARRASVPEGKALFFRRPEADESEAPPTAPAPTRQSAVFLEERQIDWLEDRCREARRNGGKAIRRPRSYALCSTWPWPPRSI